MITGIFEKVLKFTIILGVPSKLLGLLFGFLEGFVILYMTLFFLNQPFLNIDINSQSDYASEILSKTPFLSTYAEKSLLVYNEIRELTKIDDKNKLDLEMINIILKEKVTSKNVIEELVAKKKIDINDIDSVLKKYEEE